MAVELLNMDCLQYMADLPDKAFDIAIVDPEFGIGKFWMKDKKTYKYGKEKNWNEKIPDEKYFKELFRVSKNQIIWGGNYFTDFLPPVNSWIVWDKAVPAKVNFSQANLAWTSLKISIRIKRYQWSGAICPNRYGVHPCEMPVAIYKWLLKSYANPGDKILDTHGGSFSHAIAAYDLGFDLTIMEIDTDYFKSGKERFESHVAKYSPASEIAVTKEGKFKLF